jgi:Protein of unknown function (DUF1236)
MRLQYQSGTKPVRDDATHLWPICNETSNSGAAFLQRAIFFKGDHMKKQSMALTAALLLSSVAAASAATMPSRAKASDTLNLTSTQQKTAWGDLYMPSLDQKAPAGFNPVVGAVIPNGVATAAVPNKAVRSVPSLRPYDFAMVQGKLVIVNPSDKKIAEVITG